MSQVAPTSSSASTASRGGGFLATKLFARPARTDLVARPRLIERLDGGLVGSLILVSAPAGFGKTTILAEWLRSRPHVSCWLSLDAADNDPARFFTYVISALQTAAPGVADDLVAPLRSPQPPAAEAVVAALVSELLPAPDPLILVLDDYHVITSAAVNGAVAFLLENLPPSVHLVISTRSDPPIPIARLRSRGQVVEIRTDDLRFTPDEAAAFLSRTMGLDLTPEQVAALDARAEGWIAGLQMAALSMRGREDVDGFVRAFAGTHRFIMDFMLEEVLAREPEDVQTFLLRTAILTRLCGPLCDAVTGTPGGQAMLERLERRNLFVVPLDDDRHWYRYHHLFADLLQARLSQSGFDAVGPLLLRAAEWCEREALIPEAVAYTLDSRDYGRATGLISRYWPRALADGEVETVWSWLSALPEATRQSSAPLGVAYCWLLWFRGQIAAIEPHLEVAERALGELPAPEAPGADDEGHAVLPALVSTLRSVVARHHEDYVAASAHAERALDLMPGGLPPQANAQLLTVIYMTLASAYGGAGDLERAADACAQTAHWSRLGRSASGLAGATYWMMGVLRPLGRLRRAEETCREALRFVEEQGMARLPAAGLLHVLMGEVLLERNELEAAEACLARGAELGRWSGRLDAVRNAARPLARLRLARHDLDGALAAVAEAEAALGVPPAPLAEADLLALRARILAEQGALSEAARCVEEAALLAGRDRGQVGEAVGLAALRVRLAQGGADALIELTRSLDAAEGSGRLGTAIEMRILRALALAQRGDARGAEADLERALAMAEPERYVRIFVDEGEPMADLLRCLATHRARAREGAGYSAEYLATLLRAFGPPVGGRASARPPLAAGLGAPSGPASDGLVEHLTPRELEVLQLICAGASNRDIADQLVITVSTVKKHTGNILGKLGVTSRTQAMARARQLGLCAEDT